MYFLKLSTHVTWTYFNPKNLHFHFTKRSGWTSLEVTQTLLFPETEIFIGERHVSILCTL